MGDVAILERRVAVLEHRMNDHDELYARLDRKVDGIAGDVSVLKTDVSDLKTDVSVLKTDMADVKVRLGVLTDDVGGLRAGQIEIRDMVAKLLVKAESDSSRD